MKKHLPEAADLEDEWFCGEINGDSLSKHSAYHIISGKQNQAGILNYTVLNRAEQKGLVIGDYIDLIPCTPGKIGNLHRHALVLNGMLGKLDDG